MKSIKFVPNKLIVTIFLFVLIVGSFNLYAQDTKDDLLNTKITIDAEDSNVSHIIATMAKLSGCNIVLAVETGEDTKEDAVEKKITIHLKDVEIEQALGLVVKTIGLSYRLVGDKTFLVGERSRIEEEVGERTYLINLNYIDVDKVVESLEIMPGLVSPIKSQNSLMVRANPETFAEISRMVELIDIPQKQIEIRARLIEVSVTEAEKYGIDWSRINQLTTILAEDPVSSNGAGLPYNNTDATGATPYGNASSFGELPEDQVFQKMDDLDDAFKFSRQLYAFDITVDWLLENNAAQLLTDTRITAMNGEEAEIHIGEVIPFVVEDDDNQIQVEREDVGIILKVKPTVNKDGQITTVIQPEVSSVIELVGGYVPRTKVRKITSTVTVPNGNRIIVGGLLSSSITTKTNRVPILSDIPFIGNLFKHKDEVVENTDLIIEITPRIVTFEDQNLEYEVDERLERKLIKFEDSQE